MDSNKGISILGSTGSIGRQALEVCDALGLKVVSLVAGSNASLLEEQIRKYRPQIAALFDERAAQALRTSVADMSCKVLGGLEGILEAVTLQEIDTVLTSVVGIAGLVPTMAAIEAGKNIALSNKETLVTAGSLVMKKAAEKGITILPVDSEHSAVFQCLAGNRRKDAKRIILTASGGPFRGYSPEQMKTVTLEQALNHPNWSMGSKITIDSASMMNKGLEVIEAMWLFDMAPDDIEVVVHKESIIHSMVEFVDGSIIAQLGAPDMRIPIQLALTWPERVQNPFRRISLVELGSLTFEKPDFEAFPCLGLAYEAARTGGTLPAAMNAANEVAVAAFLNEEIRFHQIPGIIRQVMAEHRVNTRPSLDDIIDTDRVSRERAAEIIRDIRIKN
ncbi:MAG TPA: 1-deoxy-D-xylulose-5-phosphate reductoisomerase [Thermoclostridium caenicola]|uniref:1-deoxy-D-xylulose-5-phosphate reductoisomerase n=1 Tax=Thermoclostridium caenicola TaxID=659425 RepID=UPI002B899083|nr:1-deoxy-D-xylulose-5-phosphate reductoisomerase [Thermoclostridium caenicola]HOK43694.1 1-deoxy-D-xylulose-5-phosphate reductoisomerase [Thermoclostridium caenicola]HOL83888.1 1-deoxy-D-xylulose-5-phosphate reductoisomerase [Thermoclostridium caenicola]HPO75623.1 1-deoxy-D-xylulose-5-phosphate reductoisomerase [Thermoclostridium caenicola]